MTTFKSQFCASDFTKLGKSDVEVTRMGVGCSTFGGSMRTKMSDQVVHETLEYAINSGIRYLDVAPHYGQGYAEKRLGRELASYPPRSFVISTKVGVSLVPGTPGIQRPGLDFESPEPFESRFDFTREAVQRSLEESLARLGTDYVDIVLVHDPDEAVTLLNPSAEPFSKSHYTEVMTNVYPVLHSLREQGRIGAIGIGINQWQMCCDFARAGDFDCFLLARQYTLLLHEGTVTELVPLCEEKGIGLIIGGIYHNGILVTGSIPADGRPPFLDIGDASPDIVSRLKRIEAIAVDYGIDIQSAALQFPFRSLATASVIPGVKSAEEIQKNIFWFERKIPEDFWSELKIHGLIHPLS